MNIEPGWRFYRADFSINAGDPTALGCVTLIRDPAGRRAWHALTLAELDREDAPDLYATGGGLTFEEALANANLAAAHARPITPP